MITGAQIKSARGLLHMTQAELVELSGISFTTIRRLESVEDSNPNINTLKKVRVALNKRGIKFINRESEKENETGVVLISKKNN